MTNIKDNEQNKKLGILRGKKYMKYVIIIIYLIFTTAGVILMKLGGNPGTLSFKSGEIGLSMNFISAIGFLCYICSFLLYTRLVVMFDLSYIVPISTGIVQVVTLIASSVVFKETIKTQGYIGAIFVIIGIVVMNLNFTKVQN